ncbi:hypothetical protein PILCRDRAFT_829263 [Piloderma croceum F 1598]|uniref:Uncharacterized protein n=1 Tax=Piloderma croceum (strain F 1598) TaxID=765440 RepID=A0A0C3EL37_PILCF|nr:hypothetical protein PILCRDRAFT_829263 [Piloderma croceum F 1598]
MIPTDVQSSNSPFSQSDLNDALSQWQSVLQNQHEEFERREGERKRRNGRFRLPNHILRNWSFMLVEQISRQMRHLTTLNMSLIQTMDVDVFVHTRQLRTLWEDYRERMENFASTAEKIPIKSWEIESDEKLETEYFWTVNVSNFIDEQLQALNDRIQSLETGVNRAPSPPAALGGFHFNADPNRRGAAETSNTRARLWISQQNQGHPTGRAALPAALVSHAAMSGIGTYKTTFVTLAAISFLGVLGQAHLWRGVPCLVEHEAIWLP